MGNKKNHHSTKPLKRSKAAKSRNNFLKYKKSDNFEQPTTNNENCSPPSPELQVLMPIYTYSTKKPKLSQPIIQLDSSDEISEECYNVMEDELAIEIEDSKALPPAIDKNDQISEEYNDIMEHELAIEIEDTKALPPAINGNRVVDISYLLQSTLEIQYSHARKCTFGKLVVHEERRSGLSSNFVLLCKFCEKTFTICSEDPEKKSTLNKGLVWGTLATGSTYNHSKELLSVMDIPMMTYGTFSKIELELSGIWKDGLWRSMQDAGKEELRLAIEEKRVDDDKIPWISVYLDGGWSKRSYGHSYNAASGVAVIIGRKTGKLLFLGVPNKYCSICARAANKKCAPGEHLCFRNWAGSSPAMEADIIVEGFNNSLKMHGVKFSQFVADGDSSVYAKIREKVSYGREVEKFECRNHVIKNYGNALYKIKKDVTVYSEARNLLTTKTITHLQKTATKQIYANEGGDSEKLKEDLQNGILHVFGDHSKCCTSYCGNVGLITNSQQSISVHSTGLANYILGGMSRLLKNCNRLIENDTNNYAELYMAILARFNLGKRLNLTQRGSFETRAHLSALRYNKGIEWHTNLWKEAVHQSPGQHFNNYIKRYQHAHELKVKRRLFTKENIPPPRYTKLPKLPNSDYGKCAAEVVTDEEYASEHRRILKSLEVSEEKQNEIAMKSVGQFGNPYYEAQRRNRLTASNFGRVLRMMDHTPCHVNVSLILYPRQFTTPATEFGKIREKIACARFETEFNVVVRSAGLYVDIEHGYLAASPDGLVGDDGLLEIKCLYKVNKSGESLIQAANKDKSSTFCLEVKDGQLSLKRNHNYYYQVQGQLNICNKLKCYFVVYAGDTTDLHVEEIRIDRNLWQCYMLPKLSWFYIECILKEIILKNVPKGNKCSEPPYILEAQKLRAEKKKLREV